MKTLKTFEFGGGNRSKHDWDTLLDGGIYQLEEGEDYQSKSNTFLSLARIQAGLRGRTLTTTKVDGGVVIQAGEEGSAPVKERPSYKKDENGEKPAPKSKKK